MEWNSEVRRAFEGQGVSPDADVVEELGQHAASDYQSAVADGLDAGRAEARVRAHIAAWAADPAVHNRRPRRPPLPDGPPSSASRFAGLGHDFRYAVRLLRRQPAHGLLAIATIALGVAATTALFSVAYAVLLKPLPWPDSDRLIRVYETRKGGTNRLGPRMTSAAYAPWRERATTISDIGGWAPGRATLGDAGDPARIRVASATASLFRVLGVQPMVGRAFHESDESKGAAPVALLSYGLWRERFGGSREALGRTITLDGQKYTIVGVMPPQFAFPDAETRVWRPMQIVAMKSGLSIFNAIARLKPGATPAQAAAEGTARGRGGPDPGFVVMAVFGTRAPLEVVATPLLEAETESVRPAILVLLAAVGLLLATAVGNVASLQLARAVGRRREIAVRLALGAGGDQLVRQFLVESVILGGMGGIAALGLSAALHRALPSLLPAGFPRIDEIAFDLRVVGFAMAASLGAAIAFGLLPALEARRVALLDALSEDSLAPVGGRLRSRAARRRAVIMTAQIAIACVLLVVAALLGRSFVALVAADRGYDPSHVLTAQVCIPDTSYTATQRAALLTRLLEHLRALPGVRAAAFTTALPLVPGETVGSFTMVSPRTGTTIDVQASIRDVSPDYFVAMGIRLLEGRTFTAQDTATSPPVVMVNRAFARKYLGARVVGTQLPRSYHAGMEHAEIVGVVEDVRHRSVTDAAAPEIYQPYQQLARGVDDDVPSLVVRTEGDPMALVPPLRGTLQQLDRMLALDGVKTMDARIQTSLAQPRLYAALLGGFGALALAIAGVGLFGVLAYGVAQRRREIGVRTALGARPSDIVRLVLRQALGIMLIGIACGLAAAAASARWLSALLYGVVPYDPLTFVAVPILLLATAVVATLVPARRAAQLDPVRALRH